MTGPCFFEVARLGHRSSTSTASGLPLPLMIHPAFLGPVALCPTSGIAHGVLFGKLNRAAVADIVVVPSFGGRFTIKLGAGSYFSVPQLSDF